MLLVWLAARFLWLPRARSFSSHQDELQSDTWSSTITWLEEQLLGKVKRMYYESSRKQSEDRDESQRCVKVTWETGSSVLLSSKQRLKRQTIGQRQVFLGQATILGLANLSFIVWPSITGADARRVAQQVLASQTYHSATVKECWASPLGYLQNPSLGEFLRSSGEVADFARYIIFWDHMTLNSIASWVQSCNKAQENHQHPFHDEDVFCFVQTDELRISWQVTYAIFAKSKEASGGKKLVQ